MKDDIRKQTCLIIRRNGEYLVGRIIFSNELRWSIYPHEAYRTRNRMEARKLAMITGGTVMLFNPIVRQMKVL